MRYLKREGYHVISLKEFLEFTRFEPAAAARSVVLTFDDGYKSSRSIAYPVLKELGFTATLFVYTDYVGAGRNALSWEELKELAAEGFDVQAHSKTHGDLRKAPSETDAQFTRRMQAELEQPQGSFQQRIGPRRELSWRIPTGGWTTTSCEQGEGVRLHRRLHRAPPGQPLVRPPLAGIGARSTPR